MSFEKILIKMCLVLACVTFLISSFLVIRHLAALGCSWLLSSFSFTAWFHVFHALFLVASTRKHTLAHHGQLI